MAQVPLQRVGSSPSPGDILVVIHDFNARSLDELTLRKSERVELIELDEGFGDGWYLGRHLSSGSTGLFPGVYTTKAPSTVRPVQAHGDSKHEYKPVPAFNTTPHAITTSSLPANSSANQAQQQTGQESTVNRGYTHSQESPRASMPPPYTTYIPGVQRSIGETLGNDRPDGEESLVMNETLSVIDEHITDMSTPRQSLAPPRPVPEDSESDYSSHLDRQSYVAGPETDDEETDKLNEADVRTWNHKKTAQYLRSIGMDAKHCDIFEEQEITGDVLLDMDQSFLYMKEYDFGVMGRRLKTWHKIRDVQNEAKGQKISRQNTFSSVDPSSSNEDMTARLQQNRNTSGGTYLPRIPSLMEKPGLNIRHSQGSIPSIDEVTPGPLQTGFARQNANANTPPTAWRSSMAAEGSSRPSAAMVRELTHSRRHSSIDSVRQSDQDYTRTPVLSTSTAHKKQGSFDRGWSMSGSTAVNTINSPSQRSTEINREPLDLATTPQLAASPNPDLDRGYFSGNEVDNRKQRNTLRKRDSSSGAAHSRQSSINAAAVKRHSRLASADSIHPNGPASTSAAKAYHSSAFKGRIRSASARDSVSRSTVVGGNSPTVTNLEKEGMLTSPRNTLTGSNPYSSMQTKAKKFIGIRAISENLSQSEKPSSIQTDKFSETSTKVSPLASPTGSTTPSQTSRSLEYENSESSKLTGLATLPRAPVRTRPKVKQETSAYVRGLLKISPEEARKTCDYHGWMKKKSSSLMTTWKPRLFILRGRRLSYYYAETDTEERGIIDISGHKVLAANSDAMVTLHAQITGATSAASPTLNSDPSSTEQSPVITRTSIPGSASPFYFKLIPPKSGMSRAVQFTKPAVHYFQVDSVAQGRKWMGELMKATIMHDWSTLETTNKQKTISLAKARARGERPHALLGDGKAKESEQTEEAAKEGNANETGLNIQGLTFKDSAMTLELVGGASDDKENVETQAVDSNSANRA